MKDEIDNIIEFYERNIYKEWNRLNGSYSDIEFYFVQRTISGYVNNESSILDLGCGPGRHALELAKKGHNVYLVDIVQSNIDFAVNEFKKNKLENRIIGTKCCSASEFRIEYKFDAILAFGPFYHIIDDVQISKTIDNIKEMMAKDGYVFIIFIQMISIFKDFLKRGWIDEMEKLMNQQYPKTGIYHPNNQQQIDEYMPDFRAYSYEDAKKMLKSFGFYVEKILTCESFAAFMRPYFEKLNLSKEKYDKLLNVLYALSGESWMMNSTDHFLIVLKRK